MLNSLSESPLAFLGLLKLVLDVFFQFKPWDLILTLAVT